MEPLFAHRMLEDLRVLTSSVMAGRRTGSPGAEAARAFLEARFAEIGLRPIGDDFRHPFGWGPEGVNLLGVLPGEDPRLGWLMVTAHHDHLGEVAGEVYPGADDNASGVAALLAAASALAAEPRRRTVLFVSPDGEEQGCTGSRALLADPPFPLERVELLVNLDMLARSAAGELWVAGTWHHPELLPWVLEHAMRAPVVLRLGHDGEDPERDDWTTESDHAVFHEAGVPWLYFGVEDHADHHTPQDTFERIDREFYVEAAATVIDLLLEAADGA